MKRQVDVDWERWEWENAQEDWTLGLEEPHIDPLDDALASMDFLESVIDVLMHQNA